jgi:putative hydrolase of the HAD superfamily
MHFADRDAFADLDAVTVDGFGTLVELVDPVPDLAAMLRRHGAGRAEELVRSAFEVEARYYRTHALAGRTPGTLDELRRRCTQVFLEAAGVSLDASALAPEFVAVLTFRVAPGVAPALAMLRARGLEVAVVSNWDISLHERIDELGLRGLVTTVVTSAEAGAEKPDPRIFELALARLRVPRDRVLHVGDDDVDARGAAAAGLRFEPAPLHEALSRWS